MSAHGQSHEPGDEAQHRQPVAYEPSHARVAVIIPVRNDARRLEHCLRSILATSHPVDRLQLIVADNGSTDDAPDVARAMGAHLLSCPGIRVAAVRNHAARTATGDVLAFIDADHEVASDWIPRALEGLAQPGAGAIGAPYSAPPEGTWVQLLYDAFRVRPRHLEPTDWLPSGNFAIHRSVFLALGGFDTTLETCEDVDFCQRLRRHGFTLLSHAGLRSVHYGDPATLRALFLGELWRGRDNLRVSLRGPLTLRGLPSVVIPVVVLALLVAAVVGLLTWSLGGAQVAVLGVVGVVLLAMLRVVRMISRVPAFGPVAMVRSVAVALTYELARALALVVRVPHRVRQVGPLPPVVPREHRS